MREGLAAICNSGPKGPTILFSPPQVPGMHVVHRLTCRQNTYNLKISFFKTQVYRKVGYYFIYNQLQAAVEERRVNGYKSVPVGEHLNTGQTLYSASLLQSSGVMI